MNPRKRLVWVAAIFAGLLMVGTALAPPVFRPPPIRPPVVRPPAVRPPTFRPPTPTFRPPSTITGGTTSFTGGRSTPGTIRPAPSSAQVQTQFRQMIRTRPAEAIGKLRVGEGAFLTDAARLKLAHEAIGHLALKVERGGGAVGALQEVRQARTNANALTPEVRANLDKLAARAERRLLADGLDKVRLNAERGKWLEVVKAAEDKIVELRVAGKGVGKTSGFAKSNAEVRRTMSEARDLGAKMHALDRFEAGLKGSGRLDGVKAEHLPAALRTKTEGLQGVRKVEALAGERWTKAPDVAQVKDGVARLAKGVDAKLARQVQRDLAVKALLEGHPAEALQMLPKAASPQHAGNLLRDLKAMALGEGTVSTWPATRALGGTPGTPRGPPKGLEPLMPEGSRNGWRPPVKESAKADLPPIEKATKAGKAMEQKAAAEVKPERARLQKQARSARVKWQALRGQVLGPEKAERRRIAEVEAALDRRLNARERVNVREFVEQQKTTKEIVQVLQAQPDADDEEAVFGAALEKRLGRTLTPAERVQAGRLRKKGRSAAEAALLLMPARP